MLLQNCFVSQPYFGLRLSSPSPQFCSCSTEIGDIGHDPRLTSPRGNPAHVIAFVSGPP